VEKGRKKEEEEEEDEEEERKKLSKRCPKRFQKSCQKLSKSCQIYQKVLKF
jgi:hypothetical protein